MIQFIKRLFYREKWIVLSNHHNFIELYCERTGKYKITKKF